MQDASRIGKNKFGGDEKVPPQEKNMDQKLIKALAETMAENALTLVEIEEDGCKIKLERGAVLTAAPVPIPAAVSAAAALPTAAPAPAAETAADVIDFNHFKEIKSPMVGVFYAAPGPDAEPFVKVGDKVKKGDVVCIIEAMKLMNEITADQDGEVVDICVQNGDVVEYSQVLFKLN